MLRALALIKAILAGELHGLIVRRYDGPVVLDVVARVVEIVPVFPHQIYARCGGRTAHARGAMDVDLRLTALSLGHFTECVKTKNPCNDVKKKLRQWM